MSTPTPHRAAVGAAAKVAAFVAALAVVFGGAWAAGAQVGPIGASPGRDDDARETSRKPQAAGATLPGLAVAQDGYRLVLADTTLAPGGTDIEFAIEGPDGQPVTAFDVEHEKRLHLIVVRRDHAGYQHLHPTLDETTGAWTAPAQLTAGTWRVFADFTADGGPSLVLGGDLLVPGRVQAPDPTGEVRTDVVDGYTVSVDGALTPGEDASLALRVSKDGAPVTDLQPYLGAYGHLVALREGDLAYLHVHPGGEPGDGRTRPGPEIEFGAEVPSAGRYDLYLDFRHDDVVRTAHFVLDAGAVPAAEPSAEPDAEPDTQPDTEPGGHGGDDHSH